MEFGGRARQIEDRSIGQIDRHRRGRRNRSSSGAGSAAVVLKSRGILHWKEIGSTQAQVRAPVLTSSVR